MPTFELHPRLAADTVEIGQLSLCRILLMNDANYPWLILVPQRHGLREIYELKREEQTQLIRESSHIAHLMMAHFNADKMNIAAFGNLVPQLHIHHIARYTHDCAWPAPVFGAHPTRPYSSELLQQRRRELQERLKI
ncbi:MAG TPA: HIT domain-containing protein [bacterium]|nr:HIT domain-containing protein [bacterium]